MPTLSSSPAGIEPAVRFLDHLFGARSPDVGFRLWDDTQWPDAAPRPATIVLRHPGALRAMFGGGDEMTLAEAYVAGDFDVEGDLETACGLADRLEERPPGWRDKLTGFHHFLRLPAASRSVGSRSFTGAGRQHSLERDRAAISFHYDVSNDFYQLWLDRNLVYSCAYFRSADDDLNTAQVAKLEHLCRKLRLRAGQRLLDIGCGWGALAIHAARAHGVFATGVTLSERQAELARERAKRAGVASRVRILLRDYRELDEPGSYDAVVSVGMSEHVGAGLLPGYFQAASALLQPGGVMLNHAIGEGFRPRRHQGPSFIVKYVFPDSAIPPLPVVAAAAEGAGFEVRDVENLREHYALTLRHWVRRLEAAHDAALAHVDEPTWRTWRLYMAGSAHGFARGHLALYQVLLARPDARGRSYLPLTRDDWYEGARAPAG